MRTIKLSLAVFILSLTLFTKAQDVITFKNGDELKAKVSEVGISEIKYKKFDNLSGPEYTTRKVDVFMIKYENGTKDVFVSTTPVAPDMQKSGKCDMPPMDYDKYMKLYRKNLAGGIVMTAIGAPMILPGIALTAIGFSTGMNGYGSNFPFGDGAPFIASGGILLAAGIVCTVIGPLKIKMAKRYKAKAKELQPTMSFEPVIAPASFGQAMRTGAGIRINF